MKTARHFLVTTDFVHDDLSPERGAECVRAVLVRGSEDEIAMGHRIVSVVPMPDLDADDSDLQTGFRRLSATLRRLDQMNGVCIYSEPVELSRGQIAALVVELSKQHPARTSHVDQAALDAVRAIREADKQPGQQVQKNARAQLIITDAICRCVPEDRA